LKCAVLDDGSLSFTDEYGSPVPEEFVEAAKKQGRQTILDLIQTKCDEINEQVDSLGRLHHDSPIPKPPTFLPPSFSTPRPVPTPPRRFGFFDQMVPGRREQVDAENRAAIEGFRAALAQWEAERSTFERWIIDRRNYIERWIYTDVAAMEAWLQENLSDIVWPRETVVAFEIRDSGAAVALDVDLPEVEDMPSTYAAVPARGLKLSVKELSKAKLQKLYADHIHGIVFRIVGEVLAALPVAQEAVVAGYSQRRSPATGQLQDEYLLSVRVSRSDWSRLDFDHLASIDVVEALAQFDLRRQMSKGAILKAIKPHD
jgi:hypothetical protein